MGASIRNATSGIVTLPPVLGSSMLPAGGSVVLPYSKDKIMELLGGESRFPDGLTITDNVPTSPATPSIEAIASDFLLSVLDKDLAAPPTPAIGTRYIVASGATGAWAGHVGEIAQGLGSSWSFEVPTKGAITFVEDEGLHYAFDGSAWDTLGTTSGGGGGGSFTASESETSPALSFPIDYNDVTAVDPPAGTTFKTQAEIDAFLLAAGTSNFKHVMACWDALPTFVNQTIDFNLAYGVHRPRNPEPAPAAWFFGPYLGRPKIIGPRFFLRVQEPNTNAANWAEVVAAQTVLTNNMSASGNPNVVFSGTPFTAGKLKGYYAHFSGSTNPVMIHDNTADTLFFARTGGGTITPGTTTVRVVKPGIIFRNSYNDTTQAKGLTFQSFLTTPFGMFFNGVTLETFGGSNGMLCQSRMDILQVLIDDAGVKDQFGVTSSAQAYNQDAQNNPTIQSQVWDFAIRSGRLAAVPGGGGGGMLLNGTGGDLIMSFVSAYLDGSSFNPLAVKDAMVRFFGNVICDRTSTSGLYCAVIEGNAANQINKGRSVFRGVSGSSGKFPEFRNGIGGIDFVRALAMSWGGTVLFTGLTGAGDAAVRVGEDCDLDLSGATLLTGAAANAGRGVLVNGPRSRVKLAAATTVSGTAGEARIDGIDRTHAQLSDVRRPTTQPGSTLAGIVVVEDIEGGTATGSGTLTFTAAGTTLAFTAPGDTIGTAKDVSGLGMFVLRSNNGKWVRVFVAGTLPVGNVAQTFTIAKGIYRNPGMRFAQPFNEVEKL